MSGESKGGGLFGWFTGKPKNTGGPPSKPKKPKPPRKPKTP